MQTFVTALLLLIIIQFSQAQTATPEVELSLDSGTIENQFDYILKKSGSYRDERGRRYEVARLDWMLTLKAHTIDSLNALENQLKSTEATITAQATEIEKLKSSLKSTENNLANTISEKDSMSLFGMQMGKTGYNILMWSIIAGLFALMLFFIFKFKASNSITKSAQYKLSEVESEFEEHRRIALEREQKVRRQLQDEINKQKS